VETSFQKQTAQKSVNENSSISLVDISAHMVILRSQSAYLEDSWGYNGRNSPVEVGYLRMRCSSGQKEDAYVLFWFKALFFIWESLSSCRKLFMTCAFLFFFFFRIYSDLYRTLCSKVTLNQYGVAGEHQQWDNVRNSAK